MGEILLTEDYNSGGEGVLEWKLLQMVYEYYFLLAEENDKKIIKSLIFDRPKLKKKIEYQIVFYKILNF
jgi:hypothetical protein